MFKSGDIVRCVDNYGLNDIQCIPGEIYLVAQDSCNDKDCLENIHNVLIDINFGKFWNMSNEPREAWFSTSRFQKACKYHMTEEEKFEYIKYKLGVRDECQKKQI